MLSPFPGMDPYLENPRSWPDVHHRLISAIAISLGPQLRPKYRVAVEEAIYQTSGQDSILVGIPDVSVQRPQKTTRTTHSKVAVSPPPTQPITVTLPMPANIRQGYLEIRDVVTSEVVTALEILSPVNKRPGKGRDAYEEKRQNVLVSATHLVEIDLLRKWEPLPTLSDIPQTHYRILVSQSQHRPNADLYAFNVSDPIPLFPLPLRSEDIEPIINLKVLLDNIYDQSGYDLVIDYSRDPIPVLLETEGIWADTLLREKGLR